MKEFCLGHPWELKRHLSLALIVITETVNCFLNSPNKRSSSYQVLSLDEQKWRLGLDANQSFSYSPSNKSRTQTNALSELHCEVNTSYMNMNMNSQNLNEFVNVCKK